MDLFAEIPDEWGKSSNISIMIKGGREGGREGYSSHDLRHD